MFTTIRIKDIDTDELTTTIALAYHQNGIQVAIGPCVKVCHNQCILSPQRIVSNYGRDKVGTDQLFETVDQWLGEFETQMNADHERIRRLKNTPVSLDDIYRYIGMLTVLRVAHDSEDKTLSAGVERYPLNQSQITLFTEGVLKLRMENQNLTAWDIYNVATRIYKPGKTDFPQLIPQNISFATTLMEFCAEKKPMQ